MGDPLKKVLPGQELSIPAQAYNAFVDAALAHRGVEVTRRGRSEPAVLTAPGPDPRAQHHGRCARSLRTRRPQRRRDRPRRPAWPTSRTRPFSTPWHPGRPRTSASSPCSRSRWPAVPWATRFSPESPFPKSRSSTPRHDRADVDPSGGSLLVSSYYGAAEILFAESGTGTKWAVLRIGSFVSPVLKATANGAISVGSSGSVTIKRNGVSAQTVTAHLNWMDGSQPVATGNELLIQFFRDENKYVIVGAECP